MALKIIFGNAYTIYESIFKNWTGLDTLEERRSKLYLNFAKKCIKNEKSKLIFPRNELEVSKFYLLWHPKKNIFFTAKDSTVLQLDS